MTGFAAGKIDSRRVLVVTRRGGGCDNKARWQRCKLAFAGAIGRSRLKSRGYCRAGYGFSGVCFEHPEAKHVATHKISARFQQQDQNSERLFLDFYA